MPPQPREKRTLEEYRDEVLGLVTPLVDVEDVELAAARGRVLAEPATSRTDVPAFANSAMDGFAVRRADVMPGVVLREVGEVAAGSSADPAIGDAECVRIMTGAPLPTDADTVVPVEEVTFVDQDRMAPGRMASTGPADETVPEPVEGSLPPRFVRIDAVGPRGHHVRRPAEDLAAGDQVLPAGTVLDAHALSAAAAAGVGTLRCVRRPVVAVIATGDELVAPGGELGRGQIFESNATLLAHAVAELGAEAVTPSPSSDDPEALAALLDELAGRADLVVLSGGVSVGDHDVVRLTLDRVGVELRHVAMQPGKPQGFARWPADGRRVPVVALPGNPLSTALSFEVFVAPAIRRLLGRTDEPRWLPATALEGWRSPSGRRQLLPVTWEVGEDGRLGVRPAHRRGSASHMVTSLVAADALAMVADEVEQVEPGTTVLVRRMS